MSWKELVYNPDCVDRVTVFVDNVKFQDSRDLHGVSWIPVEVKHLQCEPRTYSLKVQIFNKVVLWDGSVDQCYVARTEETISEAPLRSYFNEDIPLERDVTGGRVDLFRKTFLDPGSIECLDTVTIESRQEPYQDWTQSRTLTGIRSQDYNSSLDIDHNQEFRVIYTFRNGDTNIKQIVSRKIYKASPNASTAVDAAVKAAVEAAKKAAAAAKIASTASEVAATAAAAAATAAANAAAATAAAATAAAVSASAAATAASIVAAAGN